MNPLYSDKDRETAIRKFVYVRSIKQAGIADYSPITSCIANERIKLLCEVAKTGYYKKTMYPYETVYYYSDKDALTYFEWLISVVSGTQEGVVSQETFTKAVNQLFLFIFGLTGTLTSKVDLLEPYSLDEHLTELKERIFRVDTKVDHMNEKMVLS
jgi:hypothetical protein